MENSYLTFCLFCFFHVFFFHYNQSQNSETQKKGEIIIYLFFKEKQVHSYPPHKNMQFLAHDLTGDWRETVSHDVTIESQPGQKNKTRHGGRWKGQEPPPSTYYRCIILCYLLHNIYCHSDLNIFQS